MPQTPLAPGAGRLREEEDAICCSSPGLERGFFGEGKGVECEGCLVAGEF